MNTLDGFIFSNAALLNMPFVSEVNGHDTMTKSLLRKSSSKETKSARKGFAETEIISRELNEKWCNKNEKS